MYIFNYLSFQVCWVILGVYGNPGIIVFGIFLYLHFALIYCLDDFPALKLEFVTLLIVCMIGITADLLLASSGIYNFNTMKLLPQWYIAMWILFGSTLNHCFYPFWRLPSIVISVLAAIFAPIAYIGLSKMTSNFSIAEPYEVSLTAICAMWFILLPLFMQITLQLRKIMLKPALEQTY